MRAWLYVPNVALVLVSAWLAYESTRAFPATCVTPYGKEGYANFERSHKLAQVLFTVAAVVPWWRVESLVVLPLFVVAYFVTLVDWAARFDTDEWHSHPDGNRCHTALVLAYPLTFILLDTLHISARVFVLAGVCVGMAAIVLSVMTKKGPPKAS